MVSAAGEPDFKLLTGQKKGMFLNELFRLTRFEHALMLAFAVFIAETIVLGGIPPFTLPIILSLLVPVFSEMGSFALNDCLDVETDRANKKKDRPLVKGTISPAFAFRFAYASLAISVALAFFINYSVFFIALAFNLLAIAYNYKLKDLPAVGNIYIALTMAIPFIFGNCTITPGHMPPLTVALALLGFVAGFAREIIKSVQDMEGDAKARGSKTLPVVIGKRPALMIAIAMYLSFIPLSAAPFFLGLEAGLPPLVFVGAADILILAICAKSAKEDYRFARDASLAAFMLGLLGILLAALEVF
ncbi:MAG: UbiA family prenyltransferase [Candidatus Micrarchaeota archaeon]